MPTLTARLQRAGTFHVIAISGGNIALLSVLSLLAPRLDLRHAGASPWRSTAAVLVAYAFVVGGGASVLRATGMAVVGLAARTLDQRASAINVLALTGAALLVADPLLAADTGFWLTTAATAGLVVGLGEAGSAARRGGGGWCRALVLTSVWAELALLPIVAAGFRAGDAGRRAAQRRRRSRAWRSCRWPSASAVPADSSRRGCWRRRASALRAGAGLVTESARVVDVAAVPQLARPAAAPGGRRRLLRWRSGRGCGRARPGSGATGRARLRPVARARRWRWRRWIAVAPASLVAWRRTHLDVTALDVGQGDAIVRPLPERRDDAGRRRRRARSGASTSAPASSARPCAPAASGGSTTWS